MNKILFSIILLFAFSICCYCQNIEPVKQPEKPVVVSQDFVDDATKAFDLVTKYRDALAKAVVSERSMSDQERKNAQIVIQGLTDLVAIKDKTIGAVEQLQAIYEKILALQSSFIDRMQKMLEIEQNSKRKNSFWQKVKEVFAVIVTIVTIKKVADVINK